MYDLACTQCAFQKCDQLQAIDETQRPCPKCGQPVIRAWLTKVPYVVGDEIDVVIENGLCWPDDTPRRFRSRQELARAAKEAGLTNRVEHIGRQGRDTSEHTTRWVAIPRMDEEARVREWHEHEVKTFGVDRTVR
ncbi:MAG: hypothetical protein ABL993_09390 [Vicinamibacterales bacterium]